jgi:hypothetical protein
MDIGHRNWQALYRHSLGRPSSVINAVFAARCHGIDADGDRNE